MKIVFFGLGSIGKRHAEILKRKYNHQLFAFRSGKNKGNDLDIPEVYSWKQLEKINPDIAFITNPTSLHIESAIKSAELGLKLFIEKPVGSNSKKLDKLLRIVKRKNLVTYVAYNRRFHPVINEVKKYLNDGTFLSMRAVSESFYPDWRKGVDSRQVYSAKKRMGGGVILDLSHEIDYAEFLLGNIKKITGSFSRRSDLTVDAEDVGDILIQTEKGPANIHLNIFSQKTQNYLEINLKDQTVYGDLIDSTVKIFKNGKLISKKQFPKERNISFEYQLEYFFKNINNPMMMNNLIEASVLFKKIIKFKQKGF
jgi:predicted dehydrogenase